MGPNKPIHGDMDEATLNAHLAELARTAPERHEALYKRLLADPAIRAALCRRPAPSPGTASTAPHDTPGSAG